MQVMRGAVLRGEIRRRRGGMEHQYIGRTMCRVKGDGLAKMAGPSMRRSTLLCRQ